MVNNKIKVGDRVEAKVEEVSVGYVFDLDPEKDKQLRQTLRNSILNKDDVEDIRNFLKESSEKGYPNSDVIMENAAYKHYKSSNVKPFNPLDHEQTK